MKKVLIVLMIFALCVSNIAAYADNNGIHIIQLLF